MKLSAWMNTNLGTQVPRGSSRLRGGHHVQLLHSLGGDGAVGPPPATRGTPRMTTSAQLDVAVLRDETA